MPDIKQELLNLLSNIRQQELAVIQNAAIHNPGVQPTDLRDMHGNYIFIPLLAAKAQVLAALANLKEYRWLKNQST